MQEYETVIICKTTIQIALQIVDQVVQGQYKSHKITKINQK